MKILAVLVLAVSVLAAITMAKPGRSTEWKFEPAKWKSSERYRYDSFNQVLRQKLLIGMKKQDLRTLLGSPNNESVDMWDYELSPTTESYGMFLVHFKNGAVEECEVKLNP